MSLIVLGRSFPKLCCAAPSQPSLSQKLLDTPGPVFDKLDNPPYHQQFWHCGGCLLFGFYKASKEAHGLDCVTCQREDRNQESLWHTARNILVPLFPLASRCSVWIVAIPQNEDLFMVLRLFLLELRHSDLMREFVLAVQLSWDSAVKRLDRKVARVNTKSLTLGEDCNSEQKRVLIDPIAITIIYYPTTSNTISVLFFKYSRNLFPLNQTLLGPATGASVDEPPSFSIRTSALKGWIWCEAWGNHNSSRLTTFAYVPLAPCLHTGKRQCHA